MRPLPDRGSQPARREVLLNPGPVCVSDRVRQALLRGDLCHREPEFARLMTSVRRLLEDLIAPAGGAGGTESPRAARSHAAILLTGSGTSAVEAAVGGCCSPGKKLAVVSNGVYGERIAEIARRHEIPVVLVSPLIDDDGKRGTGASPAWTRIPTREQVVRALEDPAVSALAAVHHETTTGLLNPIREWGEVARSLGKTFVVDSVSGIAGEDLDLDAWGIDVVCGTANKCIQGLPGISFVLARPATLAHMKTLPARSLYFDLPKNHEAQESGSPLFTPAVQVLFALEAALEELREETVPGRIARMKRASLLLRNGFRDLGLELLLPESVRSNTITTLLLPRGATYRSLHDSLKAQGYIIYAGQGGLERTVFRVANMGALGEEDLTGFLRALASALEREPAARRLEETRS